MNGARSWWPMALAVLVLLAAFAAKGLTIRAPELPRTVSSGDFDTARAIGRLQRILGDERPHPVDTPANDAVRERLISELRSIGLEPSVRKTTDCSGFPKSRTVSCSTVHNVVAVIPGPNRPALLLSAHYDSSPAGPGAADDGIGVASLLEIAEHLQREPRIRPVVLLFNEGEEFGLNGANAFVERDPLAKTIGQAINLEARGVTGPAIMFETSAPNDAAIAAYANAAKRPYANSLSTDFAKLIPNSTDVVKYKPTGWTILNYAITGNETRYHSPGDNLASLDLRSVHHMGSEALAAARQFATHDVPKGGGAHVFADVGGRFLIHLPLLVAAIGLGIIVIAALLLVQRRRAWRTMGKAALCTILPAIAVGAVATVVGLAVRGDYWRAHPAIVTLAIAASVLVMQAPLCHRLLGTADRSERRLAAWAWIALIGGLASMALPGATIYFLVGPALGLLGMRHPPLAWIGALFQLLLFVEMAALIELTLIDGPTWAIAPLVALAALPFLAETARSAPRPAVLLGSLGAIGLWTAALLVPRASAERPQGFTIDHVQDDDAKSAWWTVSNKRAPLPEAFARLGQWRDGTAPPSKRKRWITAAPILDGPNASVSLVGQKADGRYRRVRLRVANGGADAVLIKFDEKTPVRAMGLPGHLRTIPADESAPAYLRCAGRGCDGLTVDLVLGSPKPVEATLISQHYALPPQGRPLVEARPATAHPQYGPDSAYRFRRIRL